MLAGRQLLQYSCEQGQKLASAGGGCDVLCGCAIKKNGKLEPRKNECKNSCQKCVEAVKGSKCDKNWKVPGVCNDQGVPEVGQCISEFAKALGRK